VTVLAHGDHGGAAELTPSLGVAAIAIGYVTIAARQERWNGWRTTSFLIGCVLLAAALVPGVSPFPDGDFRDHMLRHLVIGMLAPTALAMGAPITLLLRGLPTRWGRVLTRLLRGRVARVFTHPLTILVLAVGGLVAMYTTPLYAVTSGDGLAHHLVHLHFLVSGYLFAWLVAGPDPAPHRPPVPTRLVLLGIAIAAHTVLSQLMYAGALPTVAVPAEQLRGAGVLMYYGGDLAELLLAAALVSTWRPPHRRPHRTGRLVEPAVDRR
jgi:putative membrane protein